MYCKTSSSLPIVSCMTDSSELSFSYFYLATFKLHSFLPCTEAVINDRENIVVSKLDTDDICLSFIMPIANYPFMDQRPNYSLKINHCVTLIISCNLGLFSPICTFNTLYNLRRILSSA